MNKKLLIAVFAVFLIGGAVFTYALTQNESVNKEEIEEETVCSGDCGGDCNGDCGAVDCECAGQQDKIGSCGKSASSCPYANQCAGNQDGSCGSSCPNADACGLNTGSCGSSACGCGK